jgi:hypothetical protein
VATSITSIDIVQSTELAEWLGDRSEQLFDRFHTLIDKIINDHHGNIYTRSGDGSTVLFPNITDGLYASIDILEAIGDLAPAGDDVALYIRIGLMTTQDRHLIDHSEGSRNRGESKDLFRVAELQKNCPVGRIAISRDVYDQLGGRQPLFRPANSPILRRLDAFVYTGRQQVAHRHLLDGMTKLKADTVPPIHTTKWKRLTPDDFSLLDVKKMFQEPLLVVFGETSRRVDTNHGSAATSDAVTVLEILAKMPPNPKVTAAIDVWEDAADLAGDRNILIVGSGMCNSFSFAINDMIDIVHFEKHAGKIYPEIVAERQAGQLRFGSRALVGRYCGLVVHCLSPFNLHRRLLWVAGVTGRGTQAAMRFVESLALSPEETLATNGIPPRFPLIAAVVTAADEVGNEMNVPSNQGIVSYRVVSAIDSNNRYLSLGNNRPSS